MLFRTRTIYFRENWCTIVLQGAKGPCPLIALLNILVLRGVIKLGHFVKDGLVTHHVLYNLLADVILERIQAQESMRQNYCTSYLTDDYSSSFPNSGVDNLSSPISSAAKKIHKDVPSNPACSNGAACSKDTPMKPNNIADPCLNANAEYITTEVLENISKLLEGADLNVRFTGIDQYELTAVVSLFDACGVRIVHGWVIDEQDHDLINEVGNKTLNTLMLELTIQADSLQQQELELLFHQQKLLELHNNPMLDQEGFHETHDEPTQMACSSILTEDENNSNATNLVNEVRVREEEDTNRSSNKSQEGGMQGEDLQGVYIRPEVPPPQVTNRLVAFQHLLNTTSDQQLTTAGLFALHEGVAEGELCVLFRAHHFSVLTKRNDVLMSLVTNEDMSLSPAFGSYENGDYLKRNVAWETIEDLEGSNTRFVCMDRVPSAEAHALYNTADHHLCKTHIAAPMGPPQKCKSQFGCSIQ